MGNEQDPPDGLKTIQKIPVPKDISLADTLEEALTKNPEILKVVNKFILRETLKSALFTAFLFLGMLSIINSAKTLLGGTYVFDMTMGVFFTVIGIAWLIKNLKPQKPKKKQM